MEQQMVDKNGNSADFFVDRHATGPDSGKPAFIEATGECRQITYADLAEQSGRLADLCERHGIAREDRAAMLVLDQIEFPIIFFGCIKAGIPPVALNTLLSTSVYDAILRDSRARALFVSSELFPTVQPALKDNPFLRAVFVIGGDTPDGCHAFATELAASQTRDTVTASADECAFWLYSSGSTGLPKGVRHVHASLKATADTYGANVLRIKPDDTVFSAAKMFFAYGLGNSISFPMSVGATTVLLRERPTPESVFDVIERTKPTVFCGVPTLYAAMVAGLEAGDFSVSCPLRCCISAGEALPEEVGKRWKALLGTDILDGVGSTEMLHIFLSNSIGDVEYGTSGTAVPGYDLRLVDENGDEVEPGVVGELLVNGESAADGYWNQRDKSRATFEGTWTRTGDKYERRKDGRYIYCGRTDDMFKVSGIWVSPFEVEQALISHPAVLEAAIVAAPDEQGLEKPKAFVVLKQESASGGLEDALREHVKEKIGKWKYPRWVEIVPDLPKTATGKIQRFKLRG
jgi:4-hydroxybenzoate-CoA ligase